MKQFLTIEEFLAWLNTQTSKFKKKHKDREKSTSLEEWIELFLDYLP